MGTQIKSESPCYYFVSGKNCKRIPMKDIIYLEKHEKNVHIYCTDDYVKERITLKEAIKKLDSTLFTEINQGQVVNLQYVDSLEENDIKLKGGVFLPVSRRVRPVLRERIRNFWEKNRFTY